MVSLSDFSMDKQGRRFADVVSDTRIDFSKIIGFFNRPEIEKRLIDAELHHKRPALAGVIVEFEKLKEIDEFFTKHDAHTTVRFRQAIGVLVKLHMQKNGWQTTNIKGALGKRDPNAQYSNTESSLSKWFIKAERYSKSCI
jgi:hypothetical protein